MSWVRFFRRQQWDRERASEMAEYLELETERNLELGMTAEEARRAAHRKLGNTTVLREEIYRMNSIGFLEVLWQDLRYAVRVLAKSPGFALIAILSLGLGIGANTAVFSLVRGVLLRPLPYAAPDRLVLVGRVDGGDAVNMPQLQFVTEHAGAFSSVAGYRPGEDANLAYGDQREWFRAVPITTGFFQTLGVTPQLGREFDAVETQRGGRNAIVITDGLWQHFFGKDPNVLGRTVALDSGTYTVVGVLPAGFWFRDPVDVFVPLRVSGGISDRGSNTFMIARLRPGVAFRQAVAEMPALSQGYQRAYPELRDANYRGLEAVPYSRWMVGETRTKLLLLFGATALLLFIACSNLAGLLLARLEQRQREIAVRLAMGSSAGRLLRQFLMENLLLCAAGSAAGLLGASWTLDSLVALSPFPLPSSAPLRVDMVVLAFTAAVTLVTGVIFSLAPLLLSTRLDVHETLKSGGRSSGGAPARQRARSTLVVAEVAFSVTLLVAAALLIQSLYRLHQERLGFSPSGLVTFYTPPTKQRFKSTADLWAFEQQIIDRMRALPGVRSVAAVNVLPLTGHSNLPAEPDGHPEKNYGGMEIRIITPGYLETMGIAITRGRGFQSIDTANSNPVVLVNETLARRWWPNVDPVGDRIAVGRYQGHDNGDPPREVIGVVADTKHEYLTSPPKPTIYVFAPQAPFTPGMAWVLRADRPERLPERIRRAIAEVEPRQRVLRIRTMDEIVGATTADSRFDAWIFGAFAVLALLLTAIGVYGLLTFAVSRRINEIGTRMALGASRASVLQLVLRQGLALTGIGLLIGLGGALALTRSLSTLLYGVRATDPLSFAVVGVLLLTVGALASYLPARRATKVDPMVALRYE